MLKLQKKCINYHRNNWNIHILYSICSENIPIVNNGV